MDDTISVMFSKEEKRDARLTPNTNSDTIPHMSTLPLADFGRVSGGSNLHTLDALALIFWLQFIDG